MADQPPVSNDSLAYLAGTAARLYPRVWVAIAMLWATVLLPVDLVFIGLSQVIPNETTRTYIKLAVMMPLFMLYFCACMSLCEAVFRGGARSPKEGLALSLSRLSAQFWTYLPAFVRMLPVIALFFAAGACVYKGWIALAVVVAAFAGAWMLRQVIVWALATPVVLFEGLSGGPALDRSGELSEGRRWLFAWHYAVYAALLSSLSILGPLIFTLALPGWVGEVCGSAISGLLLDPLSAGLFTVLYLREAARADNKS